MRDKPIAHSRLSAMVHHRASRDAGDKFMHQSGSRRARVRALVLLTSLAVCAAGLPVLASAAPVNTAAVKASEQSDNVTERPDAVSAIVTARSVGHRVEDLSQRSETTQVFANPDGTWTSEAATGPVRAQDEQGAWSDIDTSLVPVDGGFAPKSALGGLVISGGGDKTFAALAIEDRDLGWRWPTVLPAPFIEGSTATYADVVDGGNLVVTATAAGFRHDIVLTEAPTDPVSFKIPVTTGGAALTEDGSGELGITTKSGDDLVTAPAPVMYDSSEDPIGNPENVSVVDATVTKTSTGGVLTLSPDLEFLSDPATVYPVTIDPLYTTYPMADTWVSTSGTTAVHPLSEELVVGTYNGGTHKYRTFLQFANGIWDHKAVTSATLTMRNFASETCTGSAVQVARVTEWWNNGNTNWTNQPGVQGTGAANSSVAKGYSSACPSADVPWNVTAIVQGWATGATTNYGFRVAGVSETVNSSFRKYRSNDYTVPGLQPRLSVTYNSTPNTPTNLGASTLISGLVRTVTPTLSATVSDPDGGTVAGRFYVYAGSTLVWSGTSVPPVASGGTASIAVPPGKLTTGTTYSVKVNAFDASLASAAQGSLTFAVDTVAPSVIVSASGYTNEEWRDEAPASNQFTLAGDADVTSFSVEKDDAVSTLAANASGDAIHAWNPPTGAHTLRVTAIDKAGNRSAPVTFNFGAGRAAFIVPVESARSTDAFPIELTGPPGATEAVLNWRLAGSSTWHQATALSQGTSPWDGGASTDQGASSTGTVLWNTDQETVPDDEDQALVAPALIEVQGCFDYSGGPQSCTTTRTLQLVPSAFGTDLPVVDLGPASVALSTGEMALSTTDVGGSTGGVGRTFSSYDSATTQSGVFGPGWEADTLLPGSSMAAEVIDNRVKDTSIVLRLVEGGSQTFVPTQDDANVFRPLEPTGNDTSLTFVPVGAGPATLRLSTPTGAGHDTTTWQLQASDDQGTAPAWVVQEADPQGAGDVVEVTTVHQRVTWISETDSSASATCTRTVQSIGCRGLRIDYTGSGADSRVSRVVRIIGAPEDTSPAESTVATYSYNSNGELTHACGTDPEGDPSSGDPALCREYTYVTESGRTLVRTESPPGQLPWTFDYDDAGRLEKIERERPDTDPTGGTATWKVDYSLSVDAGTLPDLSAATAAQWGQNTVPTTVYAVYSPHAGTTSVIDAELYFTLEDGTVTNTATYGSEGWLVDTAWHDERGNVVRTLDGSGWSRAMDPTIEDHIAAADRASSYTVYNGEAWSVDAAVGTRVTHKYGPARTATLKNGTTDLLRSHTGYVYDDTPGVAPALVAGRTGTTGLGLVVEQSASASDASRTADYDTSIVRNDYTAIKDGDGDGWAFGTPTRVLTQAGPNIGSGLGAGDWSVAVTRFDTHGRVIETRQPGGAADGTGAGNDAHATTTTYYTASGGGDCGGHVEWVGQACKTGPAQQPAGPPVPVTWYSTYSPDLQPTEVKETSDGVLTRSSALAYDALGRTKRVVVQTHGGSVPNATIATDYAYSSEQGTPEVTASGGQVVTAHYDTWGRRVGFTDALGTHSGTTYRADGQIATVHDGVTDYTMSYDNHGLLANVNAGGGIGTFTYDWTEAGDLDKVTYPNGVVAQREHDEVGGTTSLNYRDSSASPNDPALLAFSATLDVDGRTVAGSSPGSRQDYDLDRLGRLAQVEDHRAGVCTTRSYVFNDASNREGVVSYAPTSGDPDECQRATPEVTRSYDYDTSGRIQNGGYTYDTLGRTLSVPAVDTEASKVHAASDPSSVGELVAAYHPDDSISSLGQKVPNGTGGTQATKTAYGFDPSGRIGTVTSTVDGSETQRLRYRYAGPDDSPSAIDSTTDGGNTWQQTRYVSLPVLGLVATSTAGTSQLQLSNLHGDLVATSTGTQPVASYSEWDEYGSATSESETAARYGWVGSAQRSADAPAGILLMGARVYNSMTGSFLTDDPVLNGNATRSRIHRTRSTCRILR